MNDTERVSRVARMPRWPLVPIALPAAVAIWSGWVGLGQLCGFGPVRVLPGISDWTVNTAICLPIGMEAYAAYALAVWLRPVPVPPGARRFAKRSALGALALGLLGQVAFHTLASQGYAAAPVPVVVLVSCIPVAVVGLAAALVHLMSGVQEEATEPEPETASVSASVPASLPGLREIQRRRNCSQGTAKKILAELRAFERGRGESNLTTTRAAPATQRSRDGGVSPAHSAVPAASPPAGVPATGMAPAPAGAEVHLNGSGPRG